MSEINWKSKYEALKAKFMESVDTAFRLGHEQGQQEAQMESVMQQQQQEAEQLVAQNAGMGGEEGQDPNQDPNAQEAAPDSQNPAGSELDQHINELEGMLGKSESIDLKEVMNLTNKIKTLRKNMKQEQELKKSYKAISGIAAALHKPKFKVSQQANHNLTNSAKKAVSMQETIVNDIMKNWEEESKKTGSNILDHLKAEGLIVDKKG